VLLLLPESVWVGVGVAADVLVASAMMGLVCMSLSRVAKVSIKSSRMDRFARMWCGGGGGSGSGKKGEVVQRSRGLDDAGC
jgi:hypothetical protein